MEITYIGHSCFKIKGKDITLVIDPYDPKKTGYKLPKLSADVVLATHDHEDHNFIEGVSDSRLVINTAGEYEISDVFVYGFKTYHDTTKGDERGGNIIYQIIIDGFSILHLGDLGHELSKTTLERLTDVDVLMTPVGGVYTINAKVASNVISQVEPAIVIPMHYQTPDLTGLEKDIEGLKVFLDEVGSEDNDIVKEDSLKLTSRAQVPEETEVHVLSPQH